MLMRIVPMAVALAITPAFAQQQQQPPSATQILGQQLGAVAAQNAELIEKLGQIQRELAAVAKERDELKNKLEAGKDQK